MAETKFDFDSLDEVFVDLPPVEEEPTPKVSPKIGPALAVKTPTELAKESLPSPIPLRDEMTLIEDGGKLFDFSGTSLSPIQQMYIVAYLARGTKASACQVAGVSLNTVNKWMKNKEFREALQEATEAVVDVLEQEAIRRALHGSDRLLEKMLKAYRPDKYGDKSETKVTGEIVHSWADLAQKASIDAEYEEVDDE